MQLTCDTCGRIGNEDDGIEPGGPCQEPCDGIVRIVLPIEIRDGMSATEVWWILADVINSVELAAGEDVRNEVRDYITNHYEED